MDIIFFLIGACWVAFEVASYYDWTNSRSPWLSTLNVAVGVLFCGGLWFRRRWPVAMTLIAVVLSIFSISSFAAWAILLFTAAVHRPFAISGGLAAIAVAGEVLSVTIYPSVGAMDPLETAYGSLFVTGLILTSGLLIRARRQRVLSLRDRAAALEAEHHLRVAQARHMERTRIAREMHDVLAHRLSLLCLHAGALEFRSDALPEEVVRATGVIRSSAHAALQDLRDVVSVLRDTSDAEPQRPQPTLADLTALVTESRDAGMNIDLRNTVADPATVPAGLGRNAYRVVQEALTNARKHAPGTLVTVDVSGAQEAGLTLEVRNPAPVGTSPQSQTPGTGTGLIGLGERVALAEGRLEHGWTDREEFRLSAWMPWQTR